MLRLCLFFLFFALALTRPATALSAEPRKPAADVYAGAMDDGSAVTLEASAASVKVAFAKAGWSVATSSPRPRTA